MINNSILEISTRAEFLHCFIVNVMDLYKLECTVNVQTLLLYIQHRKKVKNSGCVFD